MKILRKIRHQQKDQNGRTLFAIDVYLYEEQMVWFEDVFIHAFEESDEHAVKSDDYLAILSTAVVVHLPIDPTRDAEETKELKKKLDAALKKDQNADITPLLEELCELITAFEKIAWIYTPDFALDENGNYDDTYILKELENAETQIIPQFLSPLGTYTEYLLDNVDENVRVISEESNCWLFNCLRFLFNLMPGEFPSERTDIDQVIPQIEDELRDYVLDLSSLPGYFMALQFFGNGKEEVLYAFYSTNDEPICYFTAKEEQGGG